MIEQKGETSGSEQIDGARRQALTKLGKFAAYTAPAMMTLMVSDRAMARSGNRGKKHAKRKRGLVRRLVHLVGRLH